jgi:hypothetical protein
MNMVPDDFNRLAEEVCLGEIGDFPLTGVVMEDILRILADFEQRGILSDKRGLFLRVVLNRDGEGEGVYRDKIDSKRIDLVSDDERQLYFTDRGYADRFVDSLRGVYLERVFLLGIRDEEGNEILEDYAEGNRDMGVSSLRVGKH